MSSEAKIGLMVISCIIIFVGGLLYLGKLSIVANGYEVHVLFEFVSDLKKESKVKYAGGVVVEKSEKYNWKK